MTRLLFAVAAIALSTNATLATDWSGVDCDTLRSPARGECEFQQGKVDSTLARQAACYKFKELSDRLHKAGPEELAKVGAEDLAKGDAYLRRCAQEFPWPWSVEPAAAPAPTPPTPSALHHSRGLAALNEGDFDTAIAEFTAEIADDPKNPFPYIRRGTAYEKKGDAASAIGDYRMVLTLVDADSGAGYAAKIRKLKKTKK
jgi:tetratricopeptide (TPR) repeat protein